jgi:hypothetical protein
VAVIAVVALGSGAYLVGAVSLVAVIAVLGWGASRLRGALLPEWSGAPARLAEVVMAVAVPVALAQLLGLFGAFRRGPVLVACVAAGLAMGMVGRRLGRPVARSRRKDGAGGVVGRREELVAAVAATALVAAQWATHVAATFGRGMTHTDTLWYHQPYAARFVQTGRLTDLLDRPDALHAYVAHNSELVHALAILPFGRDLLSPLVNAGWGALALLAAWCLGRRRGVAALSLLGAVLVLGLPMVAGTQPGQASNDVAAAALLLASVALLLEGRLAPVPTGLAAVAGGLALGTKLTVAAPVLVMTVGVVVLALRAARPAAAVSWCAVLAVFGAYWFARNIALAENPLPWFDLDLGPLSLPAPVTEPGDSVADYFTAGFFWRDVVRQGLARALGRGWMVVLGLALGGGVLAVVRGRRPEERLAGAGMLLGVVAYVFTPLTADGRGLAFVFNLRYLTPVLALGLSLLALTLASGTRWRRGAWITMIGVVAVDATARHYERMPAWPAGYVGFGLLAAAGVVVAAALLTLPRSRTWKTGLVLAGVLTAAGCLGGGWLVQRHYLDHRYVDAGLTLDPIHAVFRDVRDEKVAVLGTFDVYPMFGSDLSNRVARVEEPVRGSDADPCRRWRQTLAADGYRYIVLTRQAFFIDLPSEEWISSDPATTEVFRNEDGSLYRVEGPLNPDACNRDRRRSPGG